MAGEPKKTQQASPKKGKKHPHKTVIGSQLTFQIASHPEYRVPQIAVLEAVQQVINMSIKEITVRVLPDPAPAMTNMGPPDEVTTGSCSSFSSF